MTNIRDLRQSEAVEAYLNSDGKSLIAACPRFGKIKTTIEIFKRINPKSIIIAAPRQEIFDSWKKDFKYWGYSHPNIVYVTYKSLHKLENEKASIWILDEVQEKSSKNFQSLKKICKSNDRVLCLSGTVTRKTLNNLFYNGGITTCYEYSISKGVKEGILSDYNLIIHKISLDDTVPKYQNKKGKMVTL